MTLTRTDHWATREFHDFLLARARQPFAWGGNDCALFTADAIQSFTGVDIAADFRGNYTTYAGALQLCKQVTGTGTIAAAAVYCAAQHGLVEWHAPLLARRGDLVLVEESGRLISAVVHLNGRDVVTVGKAGLQRLPIHDVRRAWAV